MFRFRNERSLCLVLFFDVTARTRMDKVCYLSLVMAQLWQVVPQHYCASSSTLPRKLSPLPMVAAVMLLRVYVYLWAFCMQFSWTGFHPVWYRSDQKHCLLVQIQWSCSFFINSYMKKPSCWRNFSIFRRQRKFNDIYILYNIEIFCLCFHVTGVLWFVSVTWRMWFIKKMNAWPAREPDKINKKREREHNTETVGVPGHGL